MKCLQALSLQSYNKNNYEILVVVDNGSTEDIRKVTDNFSQVKYVFELAKGPAAARNKGIEKAKGDVLAFTDSDCIPDKDWIKKRCFYTYVCSWMWFGRRENSIIL